MKKLAISSENGEYQLIRALKLNRAKRNKTGEIFIEGTECIKQALNAGLEITRIITADFEGLSGWARAVVAAHEGAVLITMASSLYRELSDRNEPPELLVTARIQPSKLHDLVLPVHPFVAAFDRPSDFGNLGSVIRSANAFGVDAVFIIGHGIDVYEPKVIRASLGSVFHTKVIHIESMEALETFIRSEKVKNGLAVIGTDSAGAAPLTERSLKRPLLVVIGNEAKGISVGLRALCDEIVRIPLAGRVNSLNAASAASIFMWEVYRELLMRRT